MRMRMRVRARLHGHSVNIRNAQLPADCPSGRSRDLAVAGDAGSPIHDWVEPNTVPCALAKQATLVLPQMSFELQTGDHVVDPLELPSEATMSDVTSTLTWTAVFDEVENGWIQGRIIQVPGVITAAPTLAEARANIVDALLEYLASLAEPSDEPLDTPDSELRERLDVVIRT